MIAAGAWLWAIGDVYWNFKLSKLDEIPYPSLADFFYISGYPAFFAGLAMLTHVRLNRFEKSVWLDGLIGALARRGDRGRVPVSGLSGQHRRGTPRRSQSTSPTRSATSCSRRSWSRPSP